MSEQIREQLRQLETQGFVVIPGALTPAEVDSCRGALNDARDKGWQEGLNHVGNMWFDCLLERKPDVFRPLVGHPSVRPHLEALYGPNCQLRSLRGHINPGAYLQEWHMDFYGYWHQPTSAPYALKGTGINTTFYFQDNGPGIARLTFIKGGHRIQPPESVLDERGWSRGEAAFNAWADAQEHITIYPAGGGCRALLLAYPPSGRQGNCHSGTQQCCLPLTEQRLLPRHAPCQRRQGRHEHFSNGRMSADHLNVMNCMR
jgi:hypothetical protein